MQILAGLAVAFGLLLSVFNWATLFLSRDDKNVSPAPLLGGALLAIGLLGFETTRPYWWLAVFVDFGTFALLLALPTLFGEMWAHSDRNAICIFDSTIDDRTVEIRLFRNGDCVIHISFDPPRPYGTHGNRAVSAGQVGKWGSCDNGFEVTQYSGERSLRISPAEGKRFTLDEQYPLGDEPSIYAIDGIHVDAIRLNTKA